jgi:hypothetical protein
MKKNFKIYGVASAVLLAASVMSCEDNLTSLSQDRSGSSPTPSNARSSELVIQLEERTTDIKSVKLEDGDLKEVQELLSQVDPKLYQIEIHQGGKVVDRIGSAEILDLQKVGAYYNEGFGGSVSANEILTTVSDYIKTIWTADILNSEKYVDLVARVESILTKNVVRNVTLEKAKLATDDFRNIRKAVSNIDPSLYQMEIYQDGKVISRMGSGEIADLQKVGAYYAPDFGSAVAGNEILTTVDNYIKTIWTSRLLESGKYENEVAYVENVLNQSVIQ